MRELTADTIIKVRAIHKAPAKKTLTGDTVIRLSQISDLVEDKHDKADYWTVRVWADGRKHIKTPHGWRIATQEEIKTARKAGPLENYTKAGRVKAKQKKEKHGKTMQKLLNKKEIHQAIEDFKNTKEEKLYDLGAIKPVAKSRIKKATGLEPDKVILETSSLNHAFDDKHNLMPDDLDKMKEIVDTTTDISLSPDKDDLGQPVIVFREKEPNGVFLLMEFRAGKRQLELKTAYRQKKAPKK